MLPSINLYVKVFLLFAIPFGLIVLIMDLIDGTGFDLGRSLLGPVLAGLFVSLVVVTTHIISLKALGVHDLTAESLRVKQWKHIKTQLPLKDFIARIQADPVLRKMKMTVHEDRIDLKADTSWQSFGENISIQSHPEDGNMTVYEISSTPRLKFTVVDYGKNLANVNRVANLLSTT